MVVVAGDVRTRESVGPVEFNRANSIGVLPAAEGVTGFRLQNTPIVGVRLQKGCLVSWPMDRVVDLLAHWPRWCIHAATISYYASGSLV